MRAKGKITNLRQNQTYANHNILRNGKINKKIKTNQLFLNIQQRSSNYYANVYLGQVMVTSQLKC